MSFAASLLLLGAPARSQSQAAHPADPPLNAAMAQLLRQAQGESNVVADAGFDPLVIAMREPAFYRVVVTAEPEAVDLPDPIPIPKDLKLQKSGVGKSFITKGQTAQYQATFNYRIIAHAEGSFTIAPFTVVVGNRRITVPSRTLTVVAPGSPEARRPASLHLEIPEGDCFVGQAIPLKIVVLDPGDSSVLGLVDPKALGDAFLFDRVPGSQRRELRTHNGHSVSALIEEVIAIPIREGRLPMSAQAFVERRPTTDPQSVLLPGFRPFLESGSVEIVVRHLPGGALPGFTGLIGQSMGASPRPATREVHAGDPLVLSVAVRGEGNLGRLIPPGIAHAPGWRVLNTMPDGNSPPTIRQRGSNVFYYTLIPLNPGMTDTPRIPFSYFDPQRTSFVDLTIPAIPVLVLPSAGARTMGQISNATSATSGAPDEHASEGLGRMASRPVHFTAGLVPTQQRTSFWMLQLLLGGVLTGACWWERRRRFLAAHPEIVRFARARGELRRQTRQWRRAAADGDATAFTMAAVAALRTACAPHLQASPEALVCDDVLGVLPCEEREGQSGNLVRQLFTLAEEVTFKGKVPNPKTLWWLQPELEILLAALRRRL
ncbi:MAG: BatD family protein [Verrucomicrobiota bacterium]